MLRSALYATLASSEIIAAIQRSRKHTITKVAYLAGYETVWAARTGVTIQGAAGSGKL